MLHVSLTNVFSCHIKTLLLYDIKTFLVYDIKTLIIEMTYLWFRDRHFPLLHHHLLRKEHSIVGFLVLLIAEHSM